MGTPCIDLVLWVGGCAPLLTSCCWELREHYRIVTQHVGLVMRYCAYLWT